MATIKAFTDIEQGIKLEKILPIESADMSYPYDRNLNKMYGDIPYVMGYKKFNKDTDIPCWSLAALMGVLPKIVNTQTLFIETSAALWHIGYRDVYIARSENLVDACVNMILKLHELILL